MHGLVSLPAMHAHARIAAVLGETIHMYMAPMHLAAVSRHSIVVGALAAMALSGCASVFEGKAQQISINTNPPGADCGLYREGGLRIGKIENTPGTVLIEKTKRDIIVVCVKQGYEQATFVNHSGVAGAAFANIIGGIFTLGISTAIGVAIDSSNGSDNKYDGIVNVTMIRLTGDQVAAPVALPQTYTTAGPGQVHTQLAAAAPNTEPPIATNDDRPSGGGNRLASSAAPAAQPPLAQSPAQPPPAQSTNMLQPGTWVCGMGNAGERGDNYFTLQFAIADDRTMSVASYANAPAKLVRADPLTFTAINPRGSRLTTFVMRSDNTMVMTGPSLTDPERRFRNTGTCAKS